jgi:hypothetical protein
MWIEQNNTLKYIEELVPEEKTEKLEKKFGQSHARHSGKQY